MFICIFFSAIVYQLSVNEFRQGLQQPVSESLIQRITNQGRGSITREQLVNEREEQYEKAVEHITEWLVFVNIFFLFSGGVLSYILAVRTLRPIEKARDAQSRFTADASHELRTPIAAMQTETEVALMDPKLTLAKAKNILNSNIEELGKLTALSEGMLSLARSDNTEAAGKKVNVSKLVDKAVMRVESLAAKKDITITKNIPVRTIAFGDDTGYVEALVIILDNAIKYSAEKSEVIITAKTESNTTTISVSDSGIGIKASELPYIFDRFYRSDTARTNSKTNGFGIGLAIAKSIIDKNNGEIHAQSKPGKGTTISLELPKTA